MRIPRKVLSGLFGSFYAQTRAREKFREAARGSRGKQGKRAPLLDGTGPWKGNTGERL